MLTEPITVQRDGHVLLIGINRPAKRNAVNLAAMDALCGAYEILGTDEQLRAGVLFAHGAHFSAGLDLAEVGPAVAGHGPQVLYGSHRFDPFGVWRDPVPKRSVVMAVNGIAFTLSVELALAADIVIAADDVRFRQLEIGRGIGRGAGLAPPGCSAHRHLAPTGVRTVCGAAGTAVPWGAASSALKSPDQGPKYRCGQCADTVAATCIAGAGGVARLDLGRRRVAGGVRLRLGGLTVVLDGGGALRLGAPCDRTIVTAGAANVPQCGFSSRTAGGSRYRCGKALRARHLAISPRSWLHDTSTTPDRGGDHDDQPTYF